MFQQSNRIKGNWKITFSSVKVKKVIENNGYFLIIQDLEKVLNVKKIFWLNLFQKISKPLQMNEINGNSFW